MSASPTQNARSRLTGSVCEMRQEGALAGPLPCARHGLRPGAYCVNGFCGRCRMSITAPEAMSTMPRDTNGNWPLPESVLVDGKVWTPATALPTCIPPPDVLGRVSTPRTAPPVVAPVVVPVVPPVVVVVVVDVPLVPVVPDVPEVPDVLVVPAVVVLDELDVPVVPAVVVPDVVVPAVVVPVVDAAVSYTHLTLPTS